MTKNFNAIVDEDGNVNLEIFISGFYGGIIFSSSEDPFDSGWWTVNSVIGNKDNNGVIPDEILKKIRDILNKRFPV